MQAERNESKSPFKRENPQQNVPRRGKGGLMLVEKKTEQQVKEGDYGLNEDRSEHEHYASKTRKGNSLFFV